MYFPIGWPKHLKTDVNNHYPIRHIVSSCDRMLFAVVSGDCISLWYSKPCVKIVSHTQSKKTLAKFGTYVAAEWKPDSSMIAVITSSCHVVFFRVEIDVSVPNHHCLYVQHEGKTHHNPRLNINGILDSDSIPAIKLIFETSVTVKTDIACCLCVRDEILISTVDGDLNKLKWNGNKNDKATLHLGDIPVSVDLQQFRASKLSESDGYAVDMEYSPTLGGYSLVLSSGKALFLIPPSSRAERTTAHAVKAQELNDAVTVAVNHRYRLIAFGCKTGEGIVYTIDEAVGALEVSHKLVISSKEFPDVGNIAGSVSCMKWTPDGTALALTWSNGGFSLWSVFGALLVCTLGGDYIFQDDSSLLYPSPVTSLEWGLEGYHLWMVCTKSEKVNSDETESNATNHTDNIQSELIQFQFVKSALSVNPCAGNHEHVFLQGEDKLYMSTSDTVSRHSPQPKGEPNNLDIGNKNWQIIPISHNYTATNWPIRYSAVDRAGQCIAVAGKTGFAHYALFHRKWKLFGNETQERDMVVSGGITWWKDFICLACYNIIGQQDEIRLYPRSCKLDNTFAYICKVPSQVLLLNTFRDTLIIFCADSHVMLFNIERKNTHPNPTVIVNKVQEVSLTNFIPHPLCVAGLTLTSLTSESLVTKTQHASKEAESMLLNVSGKLLMFQRDHSSQPQPSQRDERKLKPLPFCSPSVVATSVENIWATSKANLGKIQLMEALWLGCGAHGMKVWLPLYPRNESKAHNFMSKRIMLPFNVDIYPLAVLFEDAVILGVASDAVFYENSSSAMHSKSEGGKIAHLPFCILERTSQIYLHHILRQLLRRNLGFHALDLARCCTELPYFPHVLELLLHGVLEAEATSKAPIPDPLLPRVVAFIQEFPEFLQTVVHCARKTEVALWPYLFSTVGNPKDLFEECLKVGGNLETAASYLIILQNLENPKVSRQHATLLLEASLEANCWELCRDLVRFLQAIDPNDVESPPHGSINRMSGSSNYQASYPSPPLTPTDNNGFSYSNVSNIGRVRTASVAGDAISREAPRPKEKLKHTVSDSQVIPNKKKPLQRTKSNETSAEKVYIDMILSRHARKLLSTNQLRTLGYYSANMQGFQLVSWLRKERVRAAKLEDFVSALRDIHSQFEWPLPILTFNTLQQMKKDMAISISSLESSSLLEDDVLGSPTFPEKTNGNDTESSFVMSAGSSVPPRTNSYTCLSQSQSDDVLLRPQLSKTEESSLATMEISDSSSLLGEYDLVNDSLLGCEQQETLDLEMMTQEMANRGPAQSEIELRYLLQIFLEAGCLEWALVIAIVLRDALAVSRTVNTASLTDTPIDTVARMREGLSYLELWVDTECAGYKPFFHSIHTQIQVLGKISEQTVVERQASVSPRDSPTYELEDGNSSPVTQNMRTDHDVSAEDDIEHDEKNRDCIIS